jgi:hypothetical protein
VIKPRIMRLAGLVARTGDKRGAYRILVVRPEERDHLEDIGVDGNNIKMDLPEVGREPWTGLI